MLSSGSKLSSHYWKVSGATTAPPLSSSSSYFKNVYMYAIMRPSYLGGGGRRVGLPVVSLVEEKAVFPLVFTFVLVLFFVAVAVLTCLLATSLVGINIVIT